MIGLTAMFVSFTSSPRRIERPLITAGPIDLAKHPNNVQLPVNTCPMPPINPIKINLQIPSSIHNRYILASAKVFCARLRRIGVI